jgi:hypothetical protein
MLARLRREHASVIHEGFAAVDEAAGHVLQPDGGGVGAGAGGAEAVDLQPLQLAGVDRRR